MVTAVSIASGRETRPPLSRTVLCALHSALDPVGALDALGRAHAFRRVIDDVGDGGLVLVLVILVDALGDLVHALVALALGERDLGAERLVFEAGERLDHVLVTGAGI